MAILDKKFKLRGTVGPASYRVCKSKTIVQSRPLPHSTKQTSATKKCSSEFAVASNTARQIREVFLPVYQRLHDGGMVNRLNAAILLAFKGNRKQERGLRELYGADLTYLENFQFNIYSPLDRWLKVSPIVELMDNRTLSVKLPAFNIQKELKIHKWSTMIKIRIVVVAFNFRRKEYKNCGNFNIEIDPNLNYQEAVEWICPELVEPCCISFVTMSLHYYRNEIIGGMTTLNTKKIMPAAIIAAFETAAEEIDNWNQVSDTLRMPMANYFADERVGDQSKTDSFINLS